MDFYAKIEPAGEFVSGVVDTRDYDKPITQADIYGIIMDAQPKHDEVRAYGLPMLLGNRIKHKLEEAKEAVLNQFNDMPEDGRGNINWEIEYRAQTVDPAGSEFLINVDTDDEDTAVYTFMFSEYSKYSVDMEFGEDVDLSKLTIRLTHCEFHSDELPDDLECEEMWIVEGIEYDSDEAPEWEMVDRGIDSHYVLLNTYMGDPVDIEEE